MNARVWLAAMLLSAPTSIAAPAFRRSQWLADYEQLKHALEGSYSHLAWFGSVESGVDLPSLDRKTIEALRRAKTDQEATAAFDAFIAAFHDGHLVRKPWSAPAKSTLPEPPKPQRFTDASTACAALGYAPVTRVQFSLPFETLTSFSLLHDGLSDAFRSGIVRAGEVNVGVVRISRFRAAEFPAVCVKAFARVAKNGGATPDDLSNVIDPVWLEVLAERLREFRQRNVDVVLVDLGGNGGGNDLGDWAVRAFTAKPIASTPLQLVTGDAGLPYLEKEVAQLGQTLESDAGISEATRMMLGDARTRFEQRVTNARTSCSMSWVWKQRASWKALPCSRLVDADFFSGPVAFADAGTLEPPAAPALYWASVADPFRGAWNGPVMVLINEQTASSAEAFTTLMRDREIARVMGTHSMGAGCGFMNDVEPVVLENSHLTFAIPNCVRLRADGTDDVAGVTPDVLVAPTAGESARARAARLLEIIASERR